MNSFCSFKMVKIIPYSENEFNTVRTYNTSDNDVEILKRSYGVNDSLDILVSNTKYDTIQKYAELNNLTYEVKSENYGR